MRTVMLLAVVLAAAVRLGTAEEPDAAVGIEMRDVHLRVGGGIVLDVAFLRGRLVSRLPDAPPVFDDGRSYTLMLDVGEISIDERSLNALVQRALGGGQSSLSDVRVSFDGPLLRQSGKLRGGVPVPFSVTSRVDASADGRLRLRPVKMRAVGMPVKGLMRMLGLELDELLALSSASGVEAQDNDLLLSPGRILPPPEIRGTLTTVVVRGKRMVQTFGASAALRAARRAPHPSGNYVQFRGNRIRFGRLTMSPTDLRLIDADPKDAFDFYPAEYLAQLVAGYSKNTPAGGLRVFMPDYDDVTRRRVNLRPK